MPENELRLVELTRYKAGDTGVFSDVSTGTFHCYALEPNPPDIAEGTYKATYCESATLKNKDGTPKKTYLLAGVKDAQGKEHPGVRIHNGNWAGDRSKGLKSNSEGCLLLGAAVLEIAGQEGVSSSVDTVKRFEDDLEREPFMLCVRWAPGVKP